MKQDKIWPWRMMGGERKMFDETRQNMAVENDGWREEDV